MQKIPTTIITGFLGAGKTSVIRHLIEQASGKRLAFLINEFGTLGIDREMLLGCGIEGCDDSNVVELANGCICCTVAEDFVPAIQQLLERDGRVDHIIIETSGLALPKPLVQAFRWPEIAHSLSVDGVVTVLDAEALAAGQVATDEVAIELARQADDMLDHDTPLGELFADQLACADLVVLNKADQLDDAALEKLSDDIQAQCPKGVALIPARHAAVPVEVLLGIGAEAEVHIDHRHTHHDHHHDDHHRDHEDDHHHDAFHSVSFVVPESVSVEVIKSQIPDIIQQFGILRIKGFLHHPNAARREVIQAVGPRVQYYFDRPWHADETPCSNLVFIASAEVDLNAAKACFKSKL